MAIIMIKQYLLVLFVCSNKWPSLNLKRQSIPSKNSIMWNHLDSWSFTTTVYVYQQWFSEVLPSPCSNVHCTVMSVFQAVSLKGLKVTGIQWCFLPLPLMQRFILDSQNLLKILWIVEGDTPKFLAAVCWETDILRYCMLVNLTISFLMNNDVIFTTKNNTIVWHKSCRLPVKCSKQEFFKHSTTFPVFCCPVSTFLERVTGMKFWMLVYLRKAIKLITI